MLLLLPEGMVLAALAGRVRVLAALGGQVWALAVSGGQVWVPVAPGPVPRGLKHQESGWLGRALAGPASGSAGRAWESAGPGRTERASLLESAWVRQVPGRSPTAIATRFLRVGRRPIMADIGAPLSMEFITGPFITKALSSMSWWLERTAPVNQTTSFYPGQLASPAPRHRGAGSRIHQRKYNSVFTIPAN